MTTTAVQDVTDIAPIGRNEVEDLALGAYRDLVDLVAGLDDESWMRPTVCDGWTVDDMVGHVIGAAKANASLPETARQQLQAMRHRGDFDGQPLDAMNAFQVREHRHLTPAQKVTTLREIAPRAAHKRARTPRLLRGVPLPMDVGGSIPQEPTRLTLGRLNEVIYTRDAWLHRVDVARAVGIDPGLTSDVDRRLLEDVVAEWARVHGQAMTLHLDGPAGGTWQQGSGGPELRSTVADFLWGITGRQDADGLLATWVLF